MYNISDVVSVYITVAEQQMYLQVKRIHLLKKTKLTKGINKTFNAKTIAVYSCFPSNIKNDITADFYIIRSARLVMSDMLD